MKKVFNKKVTICSFSHQHSYQPSIYISPRAYGPRADMEISGWYEGWYERGHMITSKYNCQLSESSSLIIIISGQTKSSRSIAIYLQKIYILEIAWVFSDHPSNHGLRPFGRGKQKCYYRSLYTWFYTSSRYVCDIFRILSEKIILQT